MIFIYLLSIVLVVSTWKMVAAIRVSTVVESQLIVLTSKESLLRTSVSKIEWDSVAAERFMDATRSAIPNANQEQNIPNLVK